MSLRLALVAAAEPGSAGPKPWADDLGFAIAAIIIGLSAWALFWSWRKRRADRTPDWTRPESYRAHHTVRWQNDPATFRPAPQHWPLGIAAIFGICGGDPWEHLRHSDADDVRTQIAEAWGIRSRPEQLVQMHSLLTHGHRTTFAHEIASWTRLSDHEAAEAEREFSQHASDSEGAAEALWRLRKVRSNERDIRSVDFTAWDLVRFTMLCRAGVTAGYLSEAEALDSMLIPALELRARYSSWEDLSSHFMRARWYWHSVGGYDEAETDAHDQSRHDALLAPGTGPWSHVPWDIALPEPRVLLADALIAEDLITPLPPDDLYTEAGDWFDQIIRLRLGVDPDER